MRAPLLLLSVAFFAGVAVGTGFGSATLEALLVAGVALAATSWALRRPAAAALFALALPSLFVAGLLRADDGAASPGSVAAAAGHSVVLTGIVVDDPTLRGRTVELRLRGETIAVGAEQRTVTGEVLVRTPPGPAYAYGDRVRGRVALRAVAGAGRGSDYEDYLAGRGIGVTGFLVEVTIVARDQGNALRAAVSEARRDVDTALTRALDEPLVGLAQGIVTGRRDSLDPDLRDDLNATGLSHLVVISGSNVTLLAGLIVALSAAAIGRRRAALLALAVVAAYTLFVGADAPVVRAAIMATVLLLAGIAGRRPNPAAAIALAAAIMVAVSPAVIDDLSFQLSFAATVSIGLIARPLYERLARATGLSAAAPGPAAALGGVALETLVVTGAAVAATLPLLALHFGRISLVALPANLLVAPLFAPIFGGSLLTGLIGWADGSAGQAAGWLLAWLPLSWFVAVAEVGASLPFASAQIDGFDLEHAAVLYVALVGLVWWLQRPLGPAPTRPRLRLPELERPLAMVAAGILVAVNVTVWSAVAAGGADTLDLHALDVGQGDALLAVAPGGETLLVDGGPDGRRLLAVLAETLPAGQRTIDVVVASHPQADHVTGLFALLDRYRVGTLLLSPANGRTDIGRRLAAAAEERGVALRIARPGMLLTLGDEVLVDVLWPAEPIAATAEANVNNAAIVLRLRHGAVSILLTADIEAAAEIALARAGWDLDAAVLKVAHHGSGGSTTDLLLRRVRPSLALISVGEGNRFGHPQPAVLERLGDIVVLRTDRAGTITIRSDGESLRYHSER